MMSVVVVCGTDNMIQQNTASKNIHTTVIDHCRDGHGREHNKKCDASWTRGKLEKETVTATP